MPNIAICYFGMTRSTRYIYNSHNVYLYDILKQNNCSYDIYMHTWKTDKNIIWEHDCNIPVDYEEYKLLNPTYYSIDNQTEFLNSIDFSLYFDQELYDKHGGDSPFEWRPMLIRNHLCALESQKRVTNMVLSSKKIYQNVIYIRPDSELTSYFDISFLNLKDNTIAIPDENHYEGYNDRFAIVNYKDCTKYANRIDEIIDFKKNHGRIVSEKYTKFIIDKYFSDVKFIHLNFTIIRPR